MDVSDAVWRWVQKLHSMIKSFSYLAVTNDVWLNQQKNEWEWWSMKMIASKYRMGLIIHEYYPIKNNNCSYLDVTDYVQLNRQND